MQLMRFLTSAFVCLGEVKIVKSRTDVKPDTPGSAEPSD